VAASTAPTEIDRKLHRIVAEADPDKLTTAVAIGRVLAKEHAAEFTYQRNGKTEHAGADTIAQYVRFAKEIGLLNGDLAPTRAKSEVRSLDNFQRWLSDLVIRYLNEQNASLDQLDRVTRQLLNQSPRQLPTIDNIHSQLQNPPSKIDLRLALKIVALLRPRALRLVSRRLVMMPDVLVG
jgi:hypothetical protein